MGNRGCAECAFSHVAADSDPCRDCVETAGKYHNFMPRAEAVVTVDVAQHNKARREHMALTLMAALLAGNGLGKTTTGQYARTAVDAANALMEALDNAG